MNKYIVACLSIIAGTILICFFIYTQNNRFVTANAGDGKVYKINKRTGESILIVGRREIPVEPSEPMKEQTIEESANSRAQNAIHQAREASTLGYGGSNYSAIQRAVERMTGDLKIIGWQARQADEQTFVVTYSCENGNRVCCWAFEVKPQENFVRNILGDVSLEKKYGFNQPKTIEPPKQTIRPEIQKIADDIDKGMLHEAAARGDLAEVKRYLQNGEDVNARGKNGGTALMGAALNGHLEVVKYLVAKGADVNARNNNNGSTALLMAAVRDKQDVVEFLKQHGAKWLWSWASWLWSYIWRTLTRT